MLACLCPERHSSGNPWSGSVDACVSFSGDWLYCGIAAECSAQVCLKYLLRKTLSCYVYCIAQKDLMCFS